MPKYVTVLHLVLLVSQLILIGVCLGNCIDSERQALISFKQSVTNDPRNSLSSWGIHGEEEEDECCKWERIVCDNVTGHVTQLQLYGAFLSGNISPSLLNLKHLTHLNLSENNFHGIEIPSFLGSLVSLTHLDLMDAGSVVGMIPPQLGNLSNLHHLRIGSIYGDGTLYANNLEWLYGLPSLEILYISEVNLSEAPSGNLISAVSKMPSLLELRLSYCQLNQIHLPSHLHLNLTSIHVLDLSGNNLENPQLLCTFLKNLTHLQSLDLSSNILLGNTILSCLDTISNLQHLRLRGTGLRGVIPSSISNMTSLVSLDLSYNSLQEKVSWVFHSLFGCLSNSLTSLDMSYNLIFGEIPNQIVELKNLTSLRLENNNISGSIPVSIGSLSNLESLEISSNHLQGVVSEVHFANLTNLKYFDAHGNSLTLSVTPGWTPPFDLSYLDLSDWNLGPEFPLWVKSQKNIKRVGLSNTGISGSIPSWFWNNSSHLNTLDLSHNHLHGVVPNLSSQFLSVNLGSNELTGSLPHISDELWWLDLSNNSFSGELYGLLCNPLYYGSDLWVLRLGDNLLEGNIPDCWEHWTLLRMIDLQNNYLIGHLPSFMGLLDHLRSLNLGNNRLTGEIPNSLKNCSHIRAINLGQNNLVGTIPRWIGSLTRLSVLILHSNKVSGEVPYELCALDELRILDLADNNLYGAIPQCFKNAFSVTQTDGSMFYLINGHNEVARENAVLVTKGKGNQYGSILGLVTAIDLSSNNLSGQIPVELTTLQALRFLNLSRNHLWGSIPCKIGNMTALESLDLSWNNLSGQIPSTMSHLTFLSFLNLSHNNFSGEIPKSTQLQSLNSSSFVENQLLCGDPLPKRCRGGHNAPPLNEDEDEDEYGEEYWFRLGVGVGFGVGFLGIIAPLALSGIWRRTYFWFFQEYVWYHILDCIIKIKYITRIRRPV